MTADPNHRQARQAQSELDANFRAPLFAYFLKRVRDRSEAEDLTQEAFARLTARPDRQDGVKLSSYVFAIAANLLRDRARALRSRHSSFHQSYEEMPEDIALTLAEDRTPERVLIAKEQVEGVIAALKELTQQTRNIFVLSRLERIPHAEIAAAYGISVSAVEKHVIKASAHLGTRNLT